jgi:tetratricopeptide (TPR) repeat protein
LIRALKDEAERQGLAIMGDASLKTALSRWENNRNVPDRIYRRLLGAVLGLPDAEDIAVRTSVYEQDIERAIDLLEVLTRWDHEDRPVFSPTTVLVDSDRVISGYLFARSHLVNDFRPQIASYVTEPEPVASRIRAAAGGMMNADFEQGGGHVRPGIIQYFRHSVVPELCVDRPDGQRRALFGAAAEVAQLLGWSAYDAGRQAVATRYFTLGLRLADEACDQMMGARLLANLSHQYNALGKYQEALTVSRAAQAALRGRGTARVETMCVMMEVRALASMGDERGAALAIGHAERLFDRGADEEPAWISYYDAAEFSGDLAHAFRDLGAVKKSREFASAALTPATPRRTRAFIQIVDAEAAMRTGDIEEAAHLAAAALSSVGILQSERYLRYLRRFSATVPVLNHPVMAELVRELRDRKVLTGRASIRT